jgi:hypothetical protein
MENEQKWYMGAVTSPLIPGEKVVLKGQEFTIPPYNILQSIEGGEAFDTMRAAPGGKAAIVFKLRIAGIALRANYPDLTDQMIAQTLQLKHLEIIEAATKTANGLDDEGTKAQVTATPEPGTLEPTGTN